VGNPWRPTSDKSDWFAIPRKLLTKGHLRDLSGPAVKLFAYLSFLAQKHTAIRLEVANSEIEVFCGLHHETAKEAREELVRKELIIILKAKYGTLTYVLCELDQRDSDGKLLPLTPFGFPKDGGLRKYKPAPGISARTIREARKLGFKHPSRRIPTKGGVSAEPQPACRRNRDTVSAEPRLPLAQVVENSLLNSSAPSLKNSDRKGISEKRNLSPSWDEIGVEKEGKGKQGDTSVQKERAENIAAALAENSAMRRLQEKFGTRIVGIADYRTAAIVGDVGDRGVSFEEWDKRQRTLPKGVRIDQWRSGRRILTREEALSAYGEPKGTPGPAVHFVEPGEYTPKNDLGQPQRCRTHGITTWWRRPGDTTLICDRCSPNPHDETNWKEQVSWQANRPAMSAARIKTIRP
jgi:hypothetical protein